MAYAYVVNGSVVQYPFSLRELSQLTGTIYPRTASDAKMEEWGLFNVAQVAQPAYDPNFNVVEDTPTWNGTNWEQAWLQTAASPEEIAYRALFDRYDAEKLGIKADSFVQTFIGMTPAEVDTYVQANVTDLDSSKVLLRRIAIMLLLLARREFG